MSAPTPSPSHGSDAVLEAIDGLLAAARENIVAWVGVMERAEAIREQRRLGVPYTEMRITSETPPLIDAVSRNQERLGTAAAALRRAVAHMLFDAGMSHADIGRIFGVSRQRVGMLLRNEAEPVDVSAATEDDEAAEA